MCSTPTILAARYIHVVVHVVTVLQRIYCMDEVLFPMGQERSSGT